MRDWITTTIGEFIDFNPSEKLQKNKIAKKIPMDKLGTFERKIKGFVFTEYQSGPKFRNNDTLVAKITPCLENGKTAFVNILDNEEVAFGSSEFIVLRNNKLSDAKFIYYLARSPYFREKAISCMEGTSGRKRVNETVLKHLKIKVPPIETQQKIAKILSDIDDKIEVLHQINDNLAELAKTIYDYWFMQFDFPDENGKPYKTSGGKMVYNEVLKREIPEGWEVKRIEDYCKSSGGYAFKSSEWKKSGNPIIKIKNIQENNSLNIEDIDFVDMSKTIDEKFKANAGDVVIAMTGATIGKFAIVPKTDNGFYVNQRVGIFKLNEFKKLPFLINTLNQDYFRKNIIEISCGAAQPNISNEQINNIELILPISNIVEKFNSRMTICYEKIIQNRYKVYHLQSLRDWLLPMLMNGQISVE